MISWLQITLITAFAGLILVLLLILIFHRCFHEENAIAETEGGQKCLQNIEIPRIHHHTLDRENSANNHVSNGWSGFSFTDFITSSPSVDSARPLLGDLAASGTDQGGGNDLYMQKIRLNPGQRNTLVTSHNSSLTGVSSVIRTALPLPGPYNINSNLSFPQEAYFEITVLPGNIEDGKEEGIVVCVGLTGGGPIQLKLPGSFPGSVGFNSTGSVHLDGTKLVSQSQNDEWGRPGKVIGCGYNPGQKKVFFTVDSKLVHEINCKREEFGHPLYPTLASNTDITILVNFGQSPFKFEPANLQRTPNPRFIRSLLATSHVLGYEDSKDLFSMRRIGSQWRILPRNGTVRSSNMKTMNSIKGMEFDQESESDLFEIVLDSSSIGRSPSTQIYHQ